MFLEIVKQCFVHNYRAELFFSPFFVKRTASRLNRSSLTKTFRHRLDNALANAPPFAGEAEACKLPADVAATGVDAEANGDNGVDNSDSDSEDLGPETAVDVDDNDVEVRNHEPAPPTPPAHAGKFPAVLLNSGIAKSYCVS